MSEAATRETPSAVGRGRDYMPGWMRAGGALGCAALVAGFMAWEFWPRAPHERPAASAQTGFSMGRPLAAQQAAFGFANMAPAAPAPNPSPPISGFVAPPPPPPSAPTVRPMGFWEAGDAGSGASQPPAPPGAAPAGARKTDPDVATPSDYAQRMRTTAFADTAPVPHRFHVQYTIKKGEVFPCLPTQPISSELPGPVACTVTENVMSMDGSTILLPVGTQMNGSIERGLSNGIDRLFLVWTDALTPAPDLLAIPLEAPAADEMGQVGVPGDVNEHLWRKLKATLAVTLIQTASGAALAAAQQGNNNTYLNGLGGSSAPSLAEQAFAHDIDIPATLYRGPSQPLTVYVNKYIDLFHFYEDQVIR